MRLRTEVVVWGFPVWKLNDFTSSRLVLLYVYNEKQCYYCWTTDYDVSDVNQFSFPGRQSIGAPRAHCPGPGNNSDLGTNLWVR